MRVFILIIFIFVTLFAEDKYKFGVFPHMPLHKLHEVFKPMAQDLEQYIGKSVVLMTKPYYELYKDELNRGLYDIAFIQPFDYIQAHQTLGYIPVARRAADLKAILVVLKSSDYKDISDIKDKVIASAPSEAAVTKMMLKAFNKEGFRALDDFTISYSKNHFICLQKLVNSEAVACITAGRAVKHFNEEKGTDAFRTIFTTQALPHALFVVHPRVPEDIREKIQERILLWEKDEKIRKTPGKDKGFLFKTTNDSEYDSVREFMQPKD